MFRAIYVEKTEAGSQCRLADLPETQLPEGDVDVRVEYSTLNYKDGLAITGKSPVVRKFPMVAGIDLAGVVEASRAPGVKPGDRIAVTGCGLGELHWGGLAQRARVSSGWLVPLPASISTRAAAGIGTAGFTAMLSVLALERHGVTPDKGDILVTGAGGGVGGIAVALLSRLGFRVVASTGRPAEAGYLTALGAAEIVDRATLSAPGKPLGRERWAGVVDSVGSHTLANACAQTKAFGAVAACGLAQGMDFPSTVAPFILRGVCLYGINSVECPAPLRLSAWQRLGKDLDLARLESMLRVIPLADSLAAAADLIAGKVRGRLVVDVNA